MSTAQFLFFINLIEYTYMYNYSVCQNRCELYVPIFDNLLHNVMLDFKLGNHWKCNCYHVCFQLGLVVIVSKRIYNHE